MTNNSVFGLDLAKNVFHLVEVKWGGKVLRKKQLRRSQLLKYVAQLPPATIAMEACASAHYWAREFKKWGHEVVLLPPQHVKGYLHGQKNDYNDALAIAEACLHGRITPVAAKTIEQQDSQSLHRMRQLLVKEKTRLVNQLRGLLSEYGITIPKGINAAYRGIPQILEESEKGLTPRFREMLYRQYQHLCSIKEELKWYDQQVNQAARDDECCQRLMALPAFGPIVSSSFKHWLGDGHQFRRGRDASAALGLVPRQNSSGGIDRLSGITKRGDKYTRTLIVHGCRSVVTHAKHKDDPLSQWINRLVATRGFNKAVVALANKVVRMGWVIVARGEHYRPAIA